ncbi:MAG: hypothetical protein Kow0092_33150 [Deferrisomatales bacterium]
MGTTSRRLAALVVLGLVAFFSPVLGAFNLRTTWFGVPPLPLYLFSVWAALVLAAWILARRGRP